MFALWSVDDDREPYLRLATAGKLQGFFDRPPPGYDEDGVPQTVMSFRLLEVTLEVPWPESGPDGCYGLRVGVHDAGDHPIGHYHVSPTLVNAPRFAGGAVSIGISGEVSPFPQAGADVVWERWCRSQPTRVNEWAPLISAERWAWLHVVAVHAFERRRAADKAGPFTLDGTGVTDDAGFFCAVGEAVNGPGGFFGWNLDSFEDCLVRGWGAKPGFTLTWQNSKIAMESLSTKFVGEILEIFEHGGVNLILK